MNLEQFHESAKTLNTDLQTILSGYEASKQALSSVQTKIQASSKQLILAKSSVEIVEAWMRDGNIQGIRRIEETINQGLKYVFYDQSLKFRIDISSDGKEANLLINDEDTGTEDYVTEFGGGVQVVTSFLLNVVFIFVYKARHFLLLDEALTQISDQYIERIFEFINTLVKKFNFDILCVTHDLRIKTYADKIYGVAKGGTVRLLKKEDVKEAIGEPNA